MFGNVFLRLFIAIICTCFHFRNVASNIKASGIELLLRMQKIVHVHRNTKQFYFWLPIWYYRILLCFIFVFAKQTLSFTGDHSYLNVDIFIKLSIVCRFFILSGAYMRWTALSVGPLQWDPELSFRWIAIVWQLNYKYVILLLLFNRLFWIICAERFNKKKTIRMLFLFFEIGCQIQKHLFLWNWISFIVSQLVWDYESY